MKSPTLLVAILLLSCLALFAQKANAQRITGISSVTYDSSTNTVFGYSATEMDYNTQVYYQVYVRGYIYNQDVNNRLDSREAASTGQALIYVNPQVTATAGTAYNLRTEHYFRALYPICSFPGSCNKNDYYGFGDDIPFYTGISNYGPTQSFFGGRFQLAPDAFIWLGNTNTSIFVQPVVNIRNPKAFLTPQSI